MESVDAFIRQYGYSALFVGMVLEQFVPPMPGEPLLLGAGALAGTGPLRLWLAGAPAGGGWGRGAAAGAGAGHLRLWLAGTRALAGTVVGDLLWYEVGRRGGQRVMKWLCRISIEPDTCVR